MLRPVPLYCTPRMYRCVLIHSFYLIKDMNDDPNRPLLYVNNLRREFKNAIQRCVDNRTYRGFDIAIDRDLVRYTTDLRDMLVRFDRRVVGAFIGAVMDVDRAPNQIELDDDPKHWSDILHIYECVGKDRETISCYESFFPNRFPPDKNKDIALFGSECDVVSRRIKHMVQVLNEIIDRISLGITTPL